MTDRTLSRIAALLRKAESTDNEHEADAYLQAAQRLATLASVDLAVARAHSSERETRDTPVQCAIEIGEPGKRGLKTYVKLFVAIAHANSLTCDVAGNSARVFAYGFDADIGVTQALYASLVVQMVRSCDAYIESGAYATELREPEWVRDRATREWRKVRKPVHATTARINFQDAFALRIGKRLKAARQAAEARVIADDSPPVPGARSHGTGPTASGDLCNASPDRGGPASGRATGVALALRAKELEIADFYRAHSLARGTWGGYRATAGHSELSRRAGDSAGRAARLGDRAAIGGARPALNR